MENPQQQNKIAELFNCEITQLQKFLEEHYPQWVDTTHQVISHNNLLKKASGFFNALTGIPQTKSTSLPELHKERIYFNCSVNEVFHKVLTELKPWRKGPFQFADIKVQSEWDCSKKWQRFGSHINLNNMRVLDLGGGNGYYAWRCLQQEAVSVLITDPNPLAWAQFALCQRLVNNPDIAFLPLPFETLPEKDQLSKKFDLALCLGVLYHSPAPFQLLRLLRRVINPGGKAIIETLVVDGDEQTVLVPKDRYAAMPNVWAIPSLAALQRWLERCKWKNIQLISPPQYTSQEEQNATEWSNDFSLVNCLDPLDKSKTIEGYQAPMRVIVSAIA